MSSDLWSFATALYARPGVERACLQLQSEGADVCLLLCAAWLQHRQVTYSTQRHQLLETIATPWQHEVVMPLRQLRQNWRADAAHDDTLNALRDHVKGLELNAERVLLERLEKAAAEWPADEAEDDWLTELAGQHDHDALQVLRVAATRT